MSLSEFDLIKKYFLTDTINSDLVCVGIGDDAAVINTKPDEQLVISVDTLNLGIHFPQQSTAFDIGYKALAVNLSDLAAMGAQPKWFTLAVSLPSVDEAWLQGFSQGLLSLAGRYQLSLVGGDTTRGPLSITVQIAGTVPVGKGLKRSGAQIDDDIYVTGTLGDAAAALAVCQNNLKVEDQIAAALLQRLNQPAPRVEAGQALLGLATACIDVSDGFAADLGHILEASHVGADIELAKLPVSAALQHLDPQTSMHHVLYGGDDYELCFTAPASVRGQIAAVFESIDCGVTRVGKIIKETGLYQADHDTHSGLDIKGFDHFRQA